MGEIVVPDGWTGVFPDMTAEAYHQRGLGIASAGALKLVRRSLAHYKHWATSRYDKRSKAMDFGRAYHAYVLEPEVFFKEYVITPANMPRRPTEKQRKALAPSFKTLDAIAAWDEFERGCEGKEILSSEDWQKLQGMRQALDDTDMVGELPSIIMTEGKREVSMRWVDPDTGLPCRLRMDYWHQELAYGLDLKSCIDGTDEAFTRAIVKNEYHISQAHYLAGAHELGLPLRKYLFLTQETEPPYVAALTQVGSTFEELGFAAWRNAMNKLARAITAGKFPGYTTGIRTLEAPAYAFYREETEQ
jgi:hypothetical protein